MSNVENILQSAPVDNRLTYLNAHKIAGLCYARILAPHNATSAEALGECVVFCFSHLFLLSFCVGLMLSSAFPAILLYAQELLPTKLGLVSGLFFGFAFGVADIASAVLGNMADHFGIEAVYNVCAYMPILGLITYFLHDLKKVQRKVDV